MGFFGKLLSGLSDRGETAAADTESTAWDFDAWNQIGREKAQRVCSALEAIIDRGEEGDGEDFTDDMVSSEGSFGDGDPGSDEEEDDDGGLV